MASVHTDRLERRMKRSNQNVPLNIASLSSRLRSSVNTSDRILEHTSSRAAGYGQTEVDAREAGEQLELQLVDSNKLTLDQLSEIRKSFKFFDKDGDGAISLEELEVAFAALGYTHDRKLTESLFQEADANGDGSIDYREFVSLMAMSFQQQHQPLGSLSSRTDMYREAFSKFDVNGDGVIDWKDLKELMMKIGTQLEDYEIMEMILEADKNGDGVVDYSGKQ
ncbi:unnamed protein product [Mesocestoides corti]|uniref:EF-hand domain-containing protein n=1 Tax=Mesocestoides corti TaxID=53468 RepID=A0A0R3U255_MESCO|nr:unnamed protein product [Mesocestoides corti]